MKTWKLSVSPDTFLRFFIHKHPSHPLSSRRASSPHPPPFHFAASASFLQLVVRNRTANVSAWILMSDPYTCPTHANPGQFPLPAWWWFKPFLRRRRRRRNLREGHEARIPRKSCEKPGNSFAPSPHFHKTPRPAQVKANSTVVLYANETRAISEGGQKLDLDADI